MNERDELVGWALATFHTAVFVLALLLLEYANGALAGTLAGLNTLAGFAAFLALWLTTRYATRRAVGAGLRARDGRGHDFLERAFRAGAVNGVVFLWILVIAALVAVPVVTPSGGVPTLVFVLGFGTIGTPIALLVGAIAGAIFGAIDLILLGVAEVVIGRVVDGGTAPGRSWG